MVAKRLIDANELVEKIRTDWGLTHHSQLISASTKLAAADAMCKMLSEVAKMHTFAGVEVVPCRECKNWSGRNDKPGEVTAIGYCDHPNHHIIPLRADWFCADGERKDEKEVPHEENPHPV